MDTNINLDEIMNMSEENANYNKAYRDGIDRREIYIDEDIEEDFARLVTIPFLTMLNDGTNEPIHIYINCAGGNVMDGLVLCNLIDNAQCPVTIEILGYAYSMAGYIAMAGANNPNVKRVCHKFSFGLIHAGNIGYSGDARKAKQIQEFYDKIDELVKQYILEHTKITEEQYIEKSDVEWYLLASEMLELGMVDEII